MDTLKHGNKEKLLYTCKPNQCLGSGSESVGSARFWLSGSAKIPTDPDPKGKISTKFQQTKTFSTQKKTQI